jgi:CRISPR system Cascade subunit CasB
MTTTEKPQNPVRSRKPRQLGSALTPNLAKLQREYLAESSHAKTTLAQLRRGLGKAAGGVPEIWEITIAAVPGELQGKDEPSRAEQAAHAAMTLYAVHQQSLSVPTHVPGVSFGQAVGRLRFSDQRSEEAVTRRFMAVSTAESIREALWHMRGLITQLRSAQIGLDYAVLADDLLDLLTPGRATRVRLAWGRDFYRSEGSSTESVPNTDNTDPAGNKTEE